MSVQWSVIAGYLYFEIAVVILMMLPIFSPRRWHQFFKSRLFSMFQQHSVIYYYHFLGFICLLLIDAIREMRKYSHGSDSEAMYISLSIEMKWSIKLYRAQRNFYITGFSIFLAFVIKRLVTMLIIQDELSIKSEKIIKEAEATVKLSKQNISVRNIQANDAVRIEESKQKMEESKKALNEEKSKTKALEQEVKKWKLKFEAIKKQN